jgi:hypothetical protein
MRLPSTSSRDFNHIILCIRIEGHTYYHKYFLDGTSLRCGGMELPSKCMHVSNVYELGKREVDMQIFKFVTYDIEEGNERTNIHLVMFQVSNVYLNGIFSFKLYFEMSWVN